MFTAKAENKEQVIRHLDGIRGDLSRCIKLVERPLSDAVYSMVREQYASYGRRGPTGREWTRQQSTIDSYTAANRAGFGYVNEPGRRSDDLYLSESTRGAPHGILIVDDQMLTTGSDLFYGRILQDKGHKQYDPTEEDIKEFGQIIKTGQIRKIVDRGFDYKGSEIPF